MAKKRMFSLEVIDTDEFLNMPLSTQALYFHLSMRADDDGFVSSPKKIMNMTGCRQDDMNVLLTKQYIIPFDTGICVIRHWKINNYIRNDRYSETIYTSEKAQLSQNENGTYSVGIPNGIPLVDTDKSSIDKDSIVEIDTFFEQCWTLYPKKQGKGQIQPKRKKIAYELGEEFKRCIERYKQDKKDTPAEYLQHGSTFWNGGYVDYLDANYVKTDNDIKERLKILLRKYPRYSDIPEAERQGITLEQWNDYRKG